MDVLHQYYLFKINSFHYLYLSKHYLNECSF